jgi:hypothetical protein
MIDAARLTSALSVLLITVPLVANGGERIDSANVVRFNTVCASCHEGECSGRLSFHSGAAAARGHMQRYLGPVSDVDAEQLFGLLRHTKEQCTHYPVASTISAGQAASRDELARWRNPREGGYFIPLGSLAKGEHRLHIAFSAAANGKLRITDRRFEPLAEESLCPEQKRIDVGFASEAGPHFLTIQGGGALDSLLLEKLERANRN